MPDDITPDLLTPSSSEWTATGLPVADVLADADPGDLVLALPVPEGGLATEGPEAEAIGLLGLEAAAVRAAHEPAGKPGAVTTIPLVPGERGARALLLVGTGTGSADDLRTAGAALGREARGRDHVVTSIAAGRGRRLARRLRRGVLPRRLHPAAVERQARRAVVTACDGRSP